MCQQGRAVQVDPIKPNLTAPGTKRLKLEYAELLSIPAFKFNLCRYNKNSVPGEAPHRSMLDQVAEEMLWAVLTMARETSAHTADAKEGLVPEVGRYQLKPVLETPVARLRSNARQLLSRVTAAPSHQVTRPHTAPLDLSM